MLNLTGKYSHLSVRNFWVESINFHASPGDKNRLPSSVLIERRDSCHSRRTGDPRCNEINESIAGKLDRASDVMPLYTRV